jgi:putative CocE/NonD family hydrolase
MVKHPDDWLSEPRDKRVDVLRNFPVQLRAYQDFYAHPTFDSYWKQTGFDTSDYYLDMKDVPIYFVSGWYDSFAEATLRNFTSLCKIQKTEKRLLMGPWPHGYGKSQCGDVSFGPEAELDENPLQLDWFEHWMKDRPYQRIGPDPVRYFLMGSGWKTAASWPANPTHAYTFALTPGAFDYDPARPVHTLGGRNGAECIQDQKVARPDILTTLGEPLKTAMNLTGTASATLWVSSDSPSADFMVKLIDVAPSGYAAPLLEGAQRVEIKHKGPQQVVIDLGNTSNVFTPGHRVRVDVTSSSFPKFEPNPNKAHNVIYSNAKHRSTVTLQISGQ